MDYSRRKLSSEAVSNLVEISIGSLQPFRLMYAPVYLPLQKNKKLISIKAPLDFFTPAELDRIKNLKSVYLPEFIHSIKPFEAAAQRARETLTAKMKVTWEAQKSAVINLDLSSIPFEASNEVLKIIGPLWWERPGFGAILEPFHVTVFVNELCEPIPPEQLLQAREKTIVNLEAALFLSSWVVFLALHLGYCEIEFLNDLRMRVFKGRVERTPIRIFDDEIDELVRVISHSLGAENQIRSFDATFFKQRSERVSQKLGARLERIKNEFLSKGVAPSVFGKGGFIDE